MLTACLCACNPRFPRTNDPLGARQQVPKDVPVTVRDATTQSLISGTEGDAKVQQSQLVIFRFSQPMYRVSDTTETEHSMLWNAQAAEHMRSAQQPHSTPIIASGVSTSHRLPGEPYSTLVSDMT